MKYRFFSVFERFLRGVLEVLERFGRLRPLLFRGLKWDQGLFWKGFDDFGSVFDGFDDF